jgi:hypothetical protein
MCASSIRNSIEKATELTQVRGFGGLDYKKFLLDNINTRLIKDPFRHCGTCQNVFYFVPHEALQRGVPRRTPQQSISRASSGLTQ